jgi:hypothetical protein
MIRVMKGSFFYAPTYEKARALTRVRGLIMVRSLLSRRVNRFLSDSPIRLCPQDDVVRP